MTKRHVGGIASLIFCCFLLTPVHQANAADKAAKQDKAAKPAAADNKGAAAAEKPAADGKVAVVNGTVIKQNALDTEMGRYEKQMVMSGQAVDPANTAEVKKKVLNEMIDRELLNQESQRLGITVEDAEIDKQIGALKEKFPSEQEFTSALSKMNISETDLKTQYRQGLVIRKMIEQEVSSKISISPEQTRKFYDDNPEVFKIPEMVRASHILVKVEAQASDEEKAKAREKIVGLQKRVQNGEDFAAIAKESSDCPSSANGGDLDFFQKGQMVKPFEDAAFALKPGEVSDIVETQFGYHLIKVTEKKDPGVMAYDDIKEKIALHLKQEQLGQDVGKYVEQLRSKAKIEVFGVS